MMANSHKLILIVLTFFLALTFVRGFDVEVPTHALEVVPGVKISYPLTITNPTDGVVSYNIEAIGPFTAEIIGEEDSATVPANSYKTITLSLIANNGLGVGDQFDALIRVKSASEVVDVPIVLSIINSPFFGNDEPIGNDNSNADNPGTGLISFPSISNNVVNLGLFIVIIILVIALVARIKNRVVG
jgi:hypothetical protein